ncbi:MAG: nitroreductase family protein, partial [Bacteroidaceae bacterium]|nr:nitroreductase family protein [Bacteroidaceae bacterium]
DNRALLAGPAKGFRQDFVLEAPVTLLMVLDFDLFRQNDEHARTMGCVDVGNVSENINLYCQSVGLCTVPRAMMDTEAIGKLLGLNANQVPVLNNPVGFPKE